MVGFKIVQIKKGGEGYLINDYLFRKDRDRKGTLYLKCLESKRENCPARAVIENGIANIRNPDHNHYIPDLEDYEMRASRRRSKTNIDNSNTHRSFDTNSVQDAILNYIPEDQRQDLIGTLPQFEPVSDTRYSMEITSLPTVLPPSKISSLVEQWLDEDLTSFDVGGLVAGGNSTRTAHLFCKQSGPGVILAGQPFFNAVFQRLQCTVEWLRNCMDGLDLPHPALSKRHIATVRGPVADVLRGERIALNCLSRASGVATGVRKIVDMARSDGWNGKIACTRKTTPGFRLVEKYAVLCGGGDPHRYDMGSMVMLKDNHIDACGGHIGKAIEMARKLASFATKIEVESRTFEEALEAARYGADIIMLDNFNHEEAISTARRLKTTFPLITLEISGGVNAENVRNYFHESIDVISMGNLTQGYACIDFSLKLVR